MNTSSAIEKKVHRDPWQKSIILVVRHDSNLNSLSVFLRYDWMLWLKIWGWSSRIVSSTGTLSNFKTAKWSWTNIPAISEMVSRSCWTQKRYLAELQRKLLGSIHPPSYINPRPSDFGAIRCHGTTLTSRCCRKGSTAKTGRTKWPIYVWKQSSVLIAYFPFIPGYRSSDKFGICRSAMAIRQGLVRTHPARGTGNFLPLYHTRDKQAKTHSLRERYHHQLPEFQNVKHVDHLMWNVKNLHA